MLSVPAGAACPSTTSMFGRHLFADSGAVACDSLTWDASVTLSVNRWADSSWHTASAIVSDALLPITLGLPVGMYLYGHIEPHYYTSQAEYRYVSETGLQAFVTEVLTYGLAVGVKAITSRSRPYLAMPNCFVGYQQPFGTSFPSGHAAGAAALATTLSIRYPEWYVITPSVLYALATGLSRMHLGVHYLTDVVAGYALGIAVSVAVNMVNDHLFEAADSILPNNDYTLAPPVSVSILTVSLPF